jgi:succinoglycan biosynthesis protein ExoA
MPLVSIVIPCFNEHTTIRKLLEAFYAQTYPRKDLEMVIADGMSTDGTREEIAIFVQSNPDLKVIVVDNPAKSIPAALNSALKQAQGEIIIRFDAHAVPYRNYVERCVADLEAGLGENVGGVWEIQPSKQTWIAKSIAVAASHPLGVGDALYRHTTRSSKVDTVPFGAFKREVLALIGFFDETLLSNEDYEFNARIRKSGGKIWLDPAIRSIYFARSNLGALARQYGRYGFWKWRMLQRYPKTIRWRQGLPPLFVISLLGGAVLSLLFPRFWILFLLEICIYLSILTITAIRVAANQKKAYLAIGIPIAIITMHLSWGAGFLWSMIKSAFTKPDLKRN